MKYSIPELNKKDIDKAIEILKEKRDYINSKQYEKYRYDFNKDTKVRIYYGKRWSYITLHFLSLPNKYLINKTQAETLFAHHINHAYQDGEEIRNFRPAAFSNWLIIEPIICFKNNSKRELELYQKVSLLGDEYIIISQNLMIKFHSISCPKKEEIYKNLYKYAYELEMKIKELNYGKHHRKN